MGFDINCLKPGKILLKINVEQFHTIEKILKIVGFNCTLIYNQVELVPSYTVSFYKMTPGCSIVAVDKNDQQQINYWKNMSPNNEFIHRINGTHVLSREKEAVRLRDLRLNKMELKSKSFARKMCSKPELFSSISKPQKITETKYTRPETICSSPLPIFWNTETETKQNLVQEKVQKITKTEISSNEECGITC